MPEKLIVPEDTARRPDVEADAETAGLRFATVVEQLTVLGVPVRFRRVARPDDALDAAVEAEAAGRDVGHPEWADVWKSSWAVIDRLAAGDLDLSMTLDLGCGQGLTGLAVGLLGGRVVMADYELEACKLAAMNTRPVAARRGIVQLDWHRLPLCGRFTTILGSDVVYHPPDWPALDAAWRATLAPGGVVVVGEPGRETGERFLAWAAACGWQVTTTSGRPRVIELRRPGVS